MKTHDSSKQRGKIMYVSGIVLALVMVIGVTLGILYAPRKGTETKKYLAEKAKKLANAFKRTRKEIRKSLENIFGKVGKELEENYLELQENILAAVDDTQERGGLTKKKYDEIVKGAVEEFSEGKEWTKKNINELTKEFQKDWK